MHASMPPDAFPPDDARRGSAAEGNVVDPAVLSERRAQRAEVSERSAVRRAADAQSLAAELAHERARLEAERDAARAEAAAAREGADAVMAEARHLQAERDTLRRELEQERANRDAVATGHVRMQPAVTDSPTPDRSTESGTAAPPVGWAAGLRRELALARATPSVVSATRSAPSRPAKPAAPPDAAPSLARERQLVAQRVAGTQGGPAGRGAERAAPVTALALERERSSRLQAQLDEGIAVEQDLREQIAALEQAVGARRDAEARIESALQRIRDEFDAARRHAALTQAAESAADVAPATGSGAAPAGAVPAPAPASAATSPVAAAAAALPGDARVVADAPEAPGAAAPLLDSDRLNAARARLRADVSSSPPKAPNGPPAPWLPEALRRLTREEPATAGRIVAGIVAAQGLVTQRALSYDLVLAGRGCVTVDVGARGTRVGRRVETRPRSEVDVRVSADEAGLARLLYGRRRVLRRRARVQGSRRSLRELRKLAQEPLALRDLGSAGAQLDPALALRLAAFAIDPADTAGSRFTLAHAPLAGGPADAWLRVQDGAPLSVVTTRPGEPSALTVRCTRGALLPLLADVVPPPGEAAAVDGDAELLGLLRGWIARTEFPTR